MSDVVAVSSTWDGQPLPDAEQALLKLGWEGDALRIDVDSPYAGDPPPPGPVGPTDGLWSYEVVELFAVGEGESYTEIELSPHGHHWVLRLQGIRQAVARGVEIEFTSAIVGDRWTGTARIARSQLPATLHRCNAYRIWGVGEGRRYAAWAPVPGEKPDFHRLHQFNPWPL